jgi:hypothetical protein
MQLRAAATFRSAAVLAFRRSTGSKIPRIYYFEISPIGLWSNPTDFQITGSTTERLSALSLTTARGLLNG